MIRSSRFFLILILMISAVFLASCQTGVTTTASGTTAPATTASSATATQSASDETTTAATTTAQAVEWPVTVKNASGEDVVIDSEPAAIIATNVWAAEILFDLVPSERLVGLSSWGDDPALSAAADKAASVANRVSTQEPEGIVALKPDLVIIDTFSDADGSLTRTLTDAGIVVLQLASPTDFDQIKAAVATLAAAVGAPGQGAAIIDGIDQVLKEVEEKLAGLPESDRRTVMYYEDYYDQSGSSAGMLAAYGAGSPFDAIARAAGLVNVCNVQNYSAISKEKVVGEWKPDVLIVPAITYGPDFKAIDDGGASIIEAIKADELMKTLPAVQNDQVFALTEKYRGSTSQYMALAVAELARAAYPDLMD